jgi:hypothetical protein
MDHYLGLTKLPFKMTVAVMLEAAFWAQNQCSYQEAEDILLRTRRIKVNDDTIRLVTNAIGSIVFENDKRKVEAVFEKFEAGKLQFSNDKAGVLYIEADGAALNTRRRENGSSWRENKLGIAFSSDNIRYWTSDDKESEGKVQHHQIMKKELVSLIGTAEEFERHLFACAVRNGYGRYKETVFLSDGATWLRNMRETLFPDAQHILDFFHLSENVYTFAKHVFNLDESRYKPWAERICEELKASRYKDVLTELKGFSSKTDTCPVNLYGYISNNVNNIDYAAYIAKGYFIGSGAIESANKTVLQRRLKQAGMRWNIDSAQTLLTLRAKRVSGLWYQDVIIPVQECFGVNRCQLFDAED